MELMFVIIVIHAVVWPVQEETISSYFDGKTLNPTIYLAVHNQPHIR